MEQEQVIGLLAQSQDYLSGEAMSCALGVTRAAVWKEITALRREGWPIKASTRRGYRLDGPPPVLSAAYLSALLPENSIFREKIKVEPQVDSTNTRLKALAAAGAPTGSVLIAEEQTGGRGTQGRAFQSGKGDGLYLSALLRPRVALDDLLTLTGWVAVAVRKGIEQASGAPAQIKWLNDIYLDGRKLVGILTELSLLGESGEPDYVVVGIGINIAQTLDTFQAQGLEHIAISLAQAGYPVEQNRLALCVLSELDKLVTQFPTHRLAYLTQYREHCISMGRRVTFEDNGQAVTGTVRGVDKRFSLIIATDGGGERTVSSGTVSLL